jgi:RNA polymerase sigma-70 factor (ECF subfamily)
MGEAEQPADDTEPIDTNMLAQLEAALLTLPRFTRYVFLLHRVEGLRYAEIANLTGTSERRIKREMVRALCGISCAVQGQRRPWWERWSW